LILKVFIKEFAAVLGNQIQMIVIMNFGFQPIIKMKLVYLEKK